MLRTSISYTVHHDKTHCPVCWVDPLLNSTSFSGTGWMGGWIGGWIDGWMDGISYQDLNDTVT